MPVELAEPRAMPDELADVVVVGAGAAGLAAAIFAAEHAADLGVVARIVVLDGAAKVGAKILISGGGRCNVTNAEVSADDFNGPRAPIRNVLAAFDAEAAAGWFASLGVAMKTEPNGKLFPVSDRAATVLEALLACAAALGIAIRTGCRVTEIAWAPAAPENAAEATRTALPTGGPTATPTGGPTATPPPRTVVGAGLAQATEGVPTLVVVHDRGRLTARRVILATGGRSLPRTGSDGGGWAMVARLGHTVTPTFPALVPLLLDAGFWHAELAGVALPVELTTVADGRVVDRRAGSLLWTHVGVSGPVVLDASRHWLAARRWAAAVALRCSVLPGRDAAGADDWLAAAAREHGRRPMASVLGDVLPDRLARVLCRQAGVDATARASELPRAERRALATALGALALPVVGDRGWDYAEVTAGGVPMAEVDYRTLASRRAPGLHLAGEILDVDGRIGGFNFQWAWATGYLAGRGAVGSLVQGSAGR